MTFGRAFHAGNTIWAFIDQNTIPCQTHNNDNKNKKRVTSFLGVQKTLFWTAWFSDTAY